MMQDYCEIFCQAVDTIVNQAIEKLNFDKTIPCTIVDASKASQGIYTVNDGSLDFQAMSTVTTYKEKDGVYVTIPQNDADQNKIITGKISIEEQEKMAYSGPLSGMIKATGQIFDKQETAVGIIANAANEPIPTSDPEINMNQITGKPVVEAIFTEGNPMSGFTRLGIQADFKTFLSSAIKGEYGLLAVVQTSEDYEGKHYIKTGNYFFTSEEMFGDYYNFNMYYPQEVVFDISPLCSNIERISIYLVQDNNFKTFQGSEEIPYSTDVNGFNILINNCNAYLGYSIEDLKDDNLLSIYTNGSLKYSKDENENIDRGLNIRWIRKISVDESSDDYKLITSIEDLDTDDIEICWYQYNQGFGVSDDKGGTEWKRIVRYKLLNDEGQISDESPYIESEISWDRETSLYSVKDYILKKILKNKYAILNGVFKLNEALSTSLYPNDISVKENDICLNFSTETPKGALLQLKSGEWVKYEEELVPQIEFENLLSFNCKLEKKQKETQYKCIILIQDEVLTTNILKFSNTSEVVSESAVHEALSSLSIECQDGTNGNYYIYGPSYEAVDKSQSRTVRTLFPKLNSSLVDETEYQITWIVPNNNSMINISHPLSEQGYQVAEGFSEWFKDIKNLVDIKDEVIEIKDYKSIYVPLSSKSSYKFRNTTKIDDASKLIDLYGNLTASSYILLTDNNKQESALTSLTDKADDIIKKLSPEDDDAEEIETILKNGHHYEVEKTSYYKKLEETEKEKVDKLLNELHKIYMEFVSSFQNISFGTTDIWKYSSSGYSREYTIEKDFNLYSNEFIAVSSLDLDYTINQRYSPKTNFNNIVECICQKKDNKNIASRSKLEMSFGLQNSIGYSLILDFIGDDYALICREGQKAQVQAFLYDGNNNEIEIPSSAITWDWMYPESYNSIEGGFKLTKTASLEGNICTLEVIKGGTTPTYREFTDSNNLDLEPSGNYYILKGTISYAGYTLTAFLPIPLVIFNICDDDYKKQTSEPESEILNKIIDKIKDLYLVGPDNIVYSTDGTPNTFAQIEYKFNQGVFKETPEDKFNGETFLDTQCILYGRINSAENFQINEKLKNSYLKLENNFQLVPSSVYDSSRMYGVKFSEYGKIELINTINTQEEQTETVDDTAEITSANVQVQWYQPILMLQNSNSSTLINSWDGLEVKIGDDHILTPKLVVGKKDQENKFSGVALGEYGVVDESETDASKKAKTGIYGFNQGMLAYQFIDDGTGFIGGEEGRISFDGANCLIRGGAQEDNVFNSTSLVIDLNRNTILNNVGLGFITLGSSSRGFLRLGADDDKLLEVSKSSSLSNSRDLQTTLDYDGNFVSKTLTGQNKIFAGEGGINFERNGKHYSFKVNSNGYMGLFYI